MPSKFDSSLAVNTEIVELRKALKTAQLGASRSKRRGEELVNAVYSAAHAAALASGPGVPSKVALKDKRKSRGEVALIHTTDWQIGKLTSSYNVDVCARRIKELTEKVVHLTEIQRSHHPVRSCTVMFGGDMVEGITIFPGQAYEVEATLFTQLFEAAKIMETQIRTLSVNFETVNVVVEWGNHGRLGRKGDYPAGDNIDRILYNIVRDRVKDLKNVSWQGSDDWYQIVEIGNYTALLVHGDEISGGGGSVAVLKKCNAWATGVVESFDDIYMGHFHTPTSLALANGGRAFMTGSTESGSEYARMFVAAVGKPSQRLHFVDPDKGRVTAEYILWL